MAEELKSLVEKEANKATQLGAFHGFSLSKLRADVKEAFAAIGRLGMFEEYTKHDISHVDGLLKLYQWLVPEDTRERMTSADWLMLALSSYLHDFGLVVTKDEYDNRARSDFGEFCSNLEDLSDSATKDYLRQLDRFEPDRRERFLYQDFVRQNHGRRIAAWLSSNPNTRYGYDPNIVQLLNNLTQNLDSLFVIDLGLVCQSHNLDDLDNMRTYDVSKPYGQDSDQENANLQYVAILLRAADLFHITSDRTPAVAALIVNPTNPKSQVEWAKQRAIKNVRDQIGVDDEGRPCHEAKRDTIEITAYFENAEGYFALDSYLQYARKELEKCFRWAAESERSFGSRHHFPWRQIDDSKISVHGFERRAFEFQLDQRRILELLTGHTLYDNTGVVVRELVQNSIDAVRLQQCQEKAKDYAPEVNVEWDPDTSTLRVTDNGTGMTQGVIEENFLRVGASRYQDDAFRKHNPNFSPISRFGIGVLSTFMVADDVEVLTVSAEEKFARALSLRTVHGKYLIRHVDKDSTEVPDGLRKHGTQITLRLRPTAVIGDIKKQLRRYIVVPRCSVRYSSGELNTGVPIGFESARDALTDVVSRLPHVHNRNGELSDSSEAPIRIKSNRSDGLEVAYAVRWNKWFDQWEFYTVNLDEYRRSSRSLTADLRLGVCVEGIRVTEESAGFRNSTILAIVNAEGRNAPRTNVARGSLERTPEYDRLLVALYKQLCAHVADEVEELQQKRQRSLTHAIREVSYITAPLIDNPSVSIESLRSELRNVPAFVVEYSGERVAKSLAQLAEVSRLLQVESPLISHAERLLASLASSVSASEILASVGEPTFIPSDIPTITGMSGWGFFNDAFIHEWQPDKISADQKSRRVEISWECSTVDRNWIRAERANFPVPEPLLSMHHRYQLRELVAVWVPREGIEAEGLEGYDTVQIGRNQFALPGGSYLTVQALTPEIDTYTLAWTRSWLAQLSNMILRQFGPERRADGISQVVEELESLGLGTIVELSSVSTFFEHESAIYNVMRWDRYLGEQDNA